MNQNWMKKKKVSCMSTQIESADLPERFQQGNRDPESILQKLDLSQINDWDPQYNKKLET